MHQIEDAIRDIPIAVLGSAAVQDRLQSAGARTSTLSSVSNLFAARSEEKPRLIVVESAVLEGVAPDDAVRRIRSSLPLTDVLLWMPRAGARQVRDVFHAGARDVAVRSSLTALVTAAASIIDEQQILPKVDELSKQRNRTSRFESMLSRSDVMWDVFEQCCRVASANATVLIVGETGTGKELLARAIHRRSGRKGRFVACNCGSISEHLIDSELNGHVQGAFTGATRDKKGLVRHADGGTLFLDEIGDMPESVQVNVLRLLQEKKIRPVGGNEEADVDVRIVAATNVPLDDAVEAGQFREDLFYRLDVIRLEIPPLRERPEDVVFLFGCFLKKLKKHYGTNGPELSEDFLDALSQFGWPGNVRQLENFAERVVLGSTHRKLKARDVKRMLKGDVPVSPAGRQTPQAERTGPQIRINPMQSLADNIQPFVEQLERRYLEAIMHENRGRISDSAAQAGISRRTLLRKLSAFGINKADYK